MNKLGDSYLAFAGIQSEEINDWTFWRVIRKFRTDTK